MNTNRNNKNENYTNANSKNQGQNELNSFKMAMKQYANGNGNGNTIDTIADFWTNGGTSVVVAIIAVLLISLIISIVLTVFGHKARMKCVGNSKYGFYSPLIITFLILMWIGNLIPLFGAVLTFGGLVGVIVMIVLANNNCKR